MTFTIIVPIGPTTGIIPSVVSNLKFFFNRLSLYFPDPAIGMNGFADTAFFTAIKSFQKSKCLIASGTINPYDETHKLMNKEHDVQANTGGLYIWRTVGDEKVRSSHSQYDNRVRTWSDPLQPGSDFNCRCWADPLIDVTRNTLFYDEFLPEALRSGKPFISPEQFRDIYKGKLESEMTKTPSDIIFPKHNTDMVDERTRFVRLRNGKEVDMVHFMVVGRLGIPLGYVNEIQQFARGKSTGFNPQDLYSNRLGVQFFDQYARKIQYQPHKISDFIYEFLNAQK